MRAIWGVLLGACRFAPSGDLVTTSDAGPAGPADVAIDTPAAAKTCLDAWCRRKSIAIAGGKVIGGPHAGFPMLVSLPADAELAAEARADGHDILFTDFDGVTKLPYERETFVQASGHLAAWVKVPSLAANSVIYMYWGNSAAADQQDAPATWSAGYAGVWHLDESSGALHDSTINANGGAAMNGLALGSAGVVENAPTFDGSNDYLKVPASSNLSATKTAGTLELWVKWTAAAAGHFQFMFTSSNALGAMPDGYSWATQADGDFYFYPWAGDTNDYNLVTNPFTNGTWHHAAVTLASSTRTVALYLDGVAAPLAMTQVPTHWTTIASPQDWLWGGNPAQAGYFAGQLDELRVSTAVRSPGWIATEYANQHAPASFAILGVAETLQ